MIVQRYPEPFIAPMRDELARLGFNDLRTPEAVDAAIKYFLGAKEQAKIRLAYEEEFVRRIWESKDH